MNIYKVPNLIISTKRKVYRRMGLLSVSQMSIGVYTLVDTTDSLLSLLLIDNRESVSVSVPPDVLPSNDSIVDLETKT